MIDLLQAAPHVRMLRDRLLVVKAGGACLDAAGRAALARQLAVIQDLGARVVLVHGAGPQTDLLQRALGEEPEKIGGRRRTTPGALRALRHASQGEVNGDLGAALTAAGARAVGVDAGASGVLRARRRPPVTLDGREVDFGEVGDLVELRPRLLQDLLAGGWMPVLGPPAGDGEGGFLNVNADLVAAELAVALEASKLVLLLDVPGLLQDPEDPSSLLSFLDLGQLQGLEAAGALRQGMAVKARAVARALEGGVRRVHLVSGREPEALLGELYTDAGTGTLVTLHREAAEEVPV